MITDKRYEFNGSMSLDVLNNYLSRAVNYAINTSDEEQFNEDIRFLVNVGAKYVQRAGGEWLPSFECERVYPNVKRMFELAHSQSPDIIFEAAVFECITEDITTIPIPAWVFEAFGLPVEERNFSAKACYFPDGWGKDIHGTSMHAPDVTQIETQMFFYYKACTYISLGYEALHMGQTLMTGKNDTDFKCWTRLIGMIREYAKKNSRRGYVIINSHDHGRLKSSENGNFLVDFIMAPMRAHAVEGDTDHMPSEENPQRCIIEKGYWNDSPYQAGYCGTTPCGEYTDKYPYMVEFDNYGNGKPGTPGKADSYVWGLDENGWYCNQPQWYRKEFTAYLLSTLDSFEENGHLSLLGHRGSYYDLKAEKGVSFYSNSTEFMESGRNDEAWLKELLESR